MTEEPEMRALNLGCAHRPLKGFENVDIRDLPGVQTVCDLSQPWPWEDDSIDYIKATDLIEHIADSVHLMNEAWRVLKEGCSFDVLVPHIAGSGGHQDPTHVSYWNENKFLYFSVYKDEDGVMQSHQWRNIYAPDLIKAAFELELGVSDPSKETVERAGGNYGGIIYIAAKLTKRKDPLLEARHGESNTGSGSTESDG